MITRLLLTLSIFFSVSPLIRLSEASLPSEGFAEPACRTLRRFEQSLKSTVANKDGPLCMNSQPKTECTKESEETVKKCVNGIQVDVKCVQRIYENLSKDKACFCEGLITFSEMLTSVETRICVEDQGRVARLFSWTQAPKIKSAVAVINTGTIVGRILFTQMDSDNVQVSVNINGLKPGGIHGFHVHTRGDLSKGCSSMLGHYNPTNADNVSMREVGDLGVLKANSEGRVEVDKVDQLIKLSGLHNIVGRGVVIHEGAGGARLACAVIGILEEE